MSSRAVVLTLLLVAGCRGSKHAHSHARPTPPSAADAALCNDLEVWVAAAPRNFADQRTERTLKRDHMDGVDARYSIAGTQHCEILHPDPDYAEDMVECELAAAEPMADAQQLIATWIPRVAACPVVATWFDRPHKDGTHSWDDEVDDDHLIEVKLDIRGDDPTARPVLQIRRPEL